MIKQLIVAVILGLVFAGCNKDEPDKVNPPGGNGNLVLNFKIQNSSDINNQDVLLDSIFTIKSNNSINRKMKLTQVKFYVSSLIAIKENGEKISLKSKLKGKEYSHALLELLDSDDPNNENSMKITSSLPEGKYKGFIFDIGLEPTLNHADPTKYENDDPLSVNKGMVWTWKDGYRFFILEGKVDSSTNANSGLNGDMAYHTGTDELKFTQDFTDKPFEVKSDKNIPFVVGIDLYKIFSGPEEIDLRGELLTHSFPKDIALARKFNANLKTAFTVK